MPFFQIYPEHLDEMENAHQLVFCLFVCKHALLGTVVPTQTIADEHFKVLLLITFNRLEEKTKLP